MRTSFTEASWITQNGRKDLVLLAAEDVEASRRPLEPLTDPGPHGRLRVAPRPRSLRVSWPTAPLVGAVEQLPQSVAAAPVCWSPGWASYGATEQPGGGTRWV